MNENKKKKIIFIAVFFIVLFLSFVLYFIFSNKKEGVTSEPSSGFPDFNPIKTNPDNSKEEIAETLPLDDYKLEKDSIFQRLTDFAIAGAVYFEEARPVLNNQTTTEPVKRMLSPENKGDKQLIQKILNEALSITPKLTTDGVFGSKTVEAIKKFQEINDLPITGKIDSGTNQYFFITSEEEIDQKYENVPFLRYVETATGHIHELDLKNNTVSKISNTTIPKIHEAFFDKTGRTVIYRYLSNDQSISSYMATLGGAKGDFLPSNIIDLSLNPTKDKFFYLTKTSDGVVGSIKYFGNDKKETFFTFPYTEWLSQLVSDQKIYLTTKPSWSTGGNLYSLNKETGVLSKVFGGVNGLTTLVDNSGSYVLYNSSTDQGPKLNIYDIKNNTSHALDLYGLPEKCIWNNSGSIIYCAIPSIISGNQYPDSWYQGLNSSNDYFVLIDTETREVETIANVLSGQGLDATKMFLDKNEQFLFFVNKKDSTLWSLKLL